MFKDILKRESEIESPNQEELSLDNDKMTQEIRLTNGRCFELPENPSHPFLVKLFLQNNTNLTDIPPSFFELMPNLEVLDMSNTSIATLPRSVSKLLKLQMLLLKRCEMLIELPPEIGFLTNLRVLDLEETELIFLPEQIGCLLQLECLNFSLYKFADHYTKGSVISRKTLSKLASLKELSIQVNPECEWWDVEVEAIIDDLDKLGNLETLKLYLPYQSFIKFLEIKRLERDAMPLLLPSLSNFRLIVGGHEDPIFSRVPRVLQEEFMKLDKCLQYVNREEYLDVKVLPHVRALFVHRDWSGMYALSQLDLKKMNNLKFCLLAECDSMRYIIDGNHLGDGSGNNILGSVYYLGIHCMKNLHSIWNGTSSVGGFSNLKILSIHTCPELITIFHHGFLLDLILLEQLIIRDCPKLKFLVDHVYSSRNLFPRLRNISLLHLPELENIFSGECFASDLETMVIYDCPKLKNLHPLEKCSKNVKVIKGESKWWESKKSGWSREQHDYLASVFVPLKVDDDEDDELAEAMHISLTSQSQAAEGNKDLIVNTDMEMKGHPKEKPPAQALTSTYSSSSSSKTATSRWNPASTSTYSSSSSSKRAKSRWNPVKVSVRSVARVFGWFIYRNDLDEPPSVVSNASSGGTERRHGSRHVIYSSSNNSTLAREQGNVKFTMPEIYKATKNFSPTLKIGQGDFGTVYKGQLADGTLVAVKRAKKAPYDKHLGVEFQNEIITLAKIDHNNLVKYYGYLEHEDERVVVVEFVSNGTLREHLDGLQGKSLEFIARLDIGIDVAHAVTYLHMYTDHPIIHKDIKSSNILLTNTLRAKVADFGFHGLAVDTESGATDVSTQVIGTAGYLDPEYLITYQLTEKSDVYSFGVLLVELVTGRRPFEAKRETAERITARWVMNKFSAGDAIITLDPRLEKSSANNLALEKILELSLQCLAPHRQSRPSMKRCAEILWSIRKDYKELIGSDIHSTSDLYRNPSIRRE